MSFTFIDLFAGIGGIRLGFEAWGGECVFSCEWDKYAQQTYKANFGEVPVGDIHDVKEEDIPEHDILLGGFPCQAFSIAGRKGGFNDTRGTLFFEVARILKYHRPKAFFLENVKGLVMHDRGNTLKVILDVLREDLDYYVPEPKILNAKDFGVPQNRERIYIVGFRKDIDASSFKYPEPTGFKTCIRDILEEDPVSPKYYLSTTYLETLVNHRKRHESKGNGFGYEIKNLDGIANAIVVGGMGKERNLIVDERLTDFTPVTAIKGEINKQYIRRMTPREWARLQGFSDKYKIVVSDVQAYKQFGNSVAVSAVKATAEQIVNVLQAQGVISRDAATNKDMKIFNLEKGANTMSLSGNKGEWSEVYVLFRLLSQGKLYAADSDLNRIDNVFYEILKILRTEEIGQLVFAFNKDSKTIDVVKQANNTLLITVGIERFKKEAENLLQEIKYHKDAAFEVRAAEKFLNELCCHKLKAPSENKADIKIQIHDLNTGYEPILGFSIKSRLGQPSTLLNAGKTTNFVYKITGAINDSKADAFNRGFTIRERFENLFAQGCGLEFIKVDNAVFNNNLILIDADLPAISSYMLLEHFAYSNSHIINALNEVDKKNPLGYDLSTGHKFYYYKFKKLVTESALGMLPSKVWSGTADATGGYIIVREDGEVLCYHLYNRNEFEDYLLKNTKFETASTSRYGFASMYKQGSDYYIKLNMQIRFIK